MAATAHEAARFAWRPDREQAADTNVMQFAQAHGIDDYAELVRRSTADPRWFWDAIPAHLPIDWARPYDRVLDTSDGPAWARWYAGGRLNVAWNCAGRWAERLPRQPAVIAAGEDGRTTRLSFEQLWTRVRRLAGGLRSLGVEPGDRVGLFLPLIEDAVVAVHACALVGAVQVPLFSGFAPAAIAARLHDAEATVVLTADGMLRRGEPVPLLATLREALGDAPSVATTVVLERPAVGLGVALGAGEVSWARLEADATPVEEPPAFDAEHPFCLVYTSGTSGRPKGAVHASGGFLVKILQEAAHQTDVQPGDRLCWPTDLGWLMGFWSILGANGLGATVALLEGAPNRPPDRLWRFCAEQGVTILGLSPTLVRSLAPSGAVPAREHDLSALRVLASTGEPWDPAAYAWYAEAVGGGRLPVINFSGGTEVGACLLSPTPATAIKPCSVGGPALGMAVDVVDDDGASVREAVGELVCRHPWPGMTRGLWRDPERYLETYWTRLPGIWTHGDFARVDADGQWFVEGRSDDTFNVSGKRLGPAEVEAVLLADAAVADAAVVGVHHPVKGQAPWCFCVAVPGAAAGEGTAEELRERVAEALGRSFRPERVVFVARLPRTRSQKVVRRLLRDLAEGREPGDVSGLEDPGVVDELRQVVPRA